MRRLYALCRIEILTRLTEFFFGYVFVGLGQPDNAAKLLRQGSRFTHTVLYQVVVVHVRHPVVNRKMASAHFGVPLGGSALIFLTSNIYALVHFLTLFWSNSSRLT